MIIIYFHNKDLTKEYYNKYYQHGRCHYGALKSNFETFYKHSKLVYNGYWFLAENTDSKLHLPNFKYSAFRNVDEFLTYLNQVCKPINQHKARKTLKHHAK